MIMDDDDDEEEEEEEVIVRLLVLKFDTDSFTWYFMQ